MIDLIFFGLLGILLGVISGILPGLGPGTLLSILFVFLLQAKPESIIIFYIGILISAQYFGSVTAILTGVPGHPSAIPSATHGFKLATAGYGPSLLLSTAKYSLWASLFSFLLLAAFLYTGWYWARSLSTIFQSFIFLSAIVLLIFLSQSNKLHTNIGLSCLGFLLGGVGYSANFQTYFVVSSDSPLRLGIPWVPVMIGLMAIPGLLAAAKIDITISVSKVKKIITDKLVKVAFRGGVIGFILGTVPGLSYVLSSIVAAKVEERKSNNPIKIIVASEAANNAGAVSMLLPLFLLGIPITVSEAIVFSLLTSNTAMSSIPKLILDNWILLSCYFVFINILFFIIACKFAIPLCNFLFSSINILIGVAVVVAIFGVAWLGWYHQQIFLYLLILLISSVLGSLIRLDWSITIFSMILYTHIETNIYKLIQLYF